MKNNSFKIFLEQLNNAKIIYYLGNYYKPESLYSEREPYLNKEQIYCSLKFLYEYNSFNTEPNMLIPQEIPDKTLPVTELYKLYLTNEITLL